jgi:hypothetical protein
MGLVAGAINVFIEMLETASADLGLPQLWHRNKSDSRKITLTEGTGTGQGDRVYSDVLELAGANQSLDLSGSLTSKLNGATVSFAKIKGIYIRHRGTTSGQDLTVSGTGLVFLGGTSPTITLKAGHLFVLGGSTEGYTVTNSSADTLTFAPGANTFDVEVIIWGTSA